MMLGLEATGDERYAISNDPAGAAPVVVVPTVNQPAVAAPQDILNLPAPAGYASYIDSQGNVITPITGGGYLLTTPAGAESTNSGALPTGRYYLSTPVGAQPTQDSGLMTMLVVAAAASLLLLRRT